jgi:hypothetical protein
VGRRIGRDEEERPKGRGYNVAAGTRA